MKQALRDAFEAEMAEGSRLYEQARYAAAFHRFERAHILGQRFVGPHTRTHVWMLRIGWKTSSIREILAQLIRIPGGIVGSAIGLVPIGNNQPETPTRTPARTWSSECQQATVSFASTAALLREHDTL